MKLTTSELVYINDIAKALKQKNFIIIDNVMIGLDNIENIVTYTLLDTNFITNYNNGIIINQRQLSAFVKNLSVESDFEFDSINGSNVIRTVTGVELTIFYDQRVAILACDKFKHAIMLDNTSKISINEVEVGDMLVTLQGMKSGDGAIMFNYNGYLMTIFPTILPTNKSDKLYLTILQPHQLNTFIAKFRIKKKKNDIITYINYLKI